jgi:sugar phosphate isomerase/epimerase
MKIGLKIKYAWNTPTVIPHLEKLKGKIDHFELGVRVGEDYKDFDPLREAGVNFTIHAPFQQDGVNPGEYAKDGPTKKGLDYAIEAADYFNSEVIVVHPGHDMDIDGFSFDHMIEILREYKDERFHLENLSRTSWTISQMKEMRDETGFKTCLDVGHALMKSKRENRDAYEYIKDLAGACPPTYFHLHNNDRELDRHWQITNPAGFADYGKLKYLFNDNSFVTLEISLFGKESFKGDTFDIDGALKDIAFVRQITKN